MADDEFDWCADVAPPRKQYLDDLLVLDPEIGEVALWKAIAWNTAKLRNAMARADAAEPTPLRDEDRPPPIVADQTQTSRTTLTQGELRAIEDAVDRLDARLSALEQRKRAEDALLDAEAEIEKELEKLDPPSDDDTATMH
jgi:hypothetical protein